MYNYREKMLFFHEKYVINMIERIITFDFSVRIFVGIV